jgi:SH3-like domain-containing protein
MIMKKSNLSKFSFCLVTILSTIALTSACFAADFVSVKKDGVNIRSGPSTKNKIIWEVFASFPLQVIERKGKWVHVIDFEDDKGWIYESLITDKKTVIIKVETANMRSGPSKDNPIIATVKKGVVFEPIEMQGNWMKVSYKNDISGWIHNTLLWPSNL